MGHLQVVTLTLGVAIQCAGLLYVSKVWVGERDLVPPPKPNKSKLQPEDGTHAGPKHVVVSPMY